MNPETVIEDIDGRAEDVLCNNKSGTPRMRSETEVITVIFFTALIFIARTVGAGAAEKSAEPMKLDFRSALSLALQKSPLLSMSEADVKRSESDYLTSLSEYLPDLEGNVSQSRQVINLQTTGIAFVLPKSSSGGGFPNLASIKKVGPYNVFDARVSVEQTILDLTAIYNIHAGKQGVSASEFSYDDTRQVVETRTVAAYIEALRSVAEVKRTASDQKTAQTLYQLAEDLHKVGIDTGLDVTRAEVQLRNAQQEAIAAKNNHEVALMFLAKTIGISPQTPLALKDELDYERTIGKTRQELIDTAFKTRPDLLALKARENEYNLLTKSARAEYLPKLLFHFDYGANGLTPYDAVIPTWTVAGVLRVPIFNGGRTIADIGRANANLIHVKSQIDDLKNQIEFEVGSALLSLDSAYESVKVARSGLTLAQKSLELSQDRFKQGLTNNVEVINAQNDLVRSEENLIRAFYNYNLARVALARAVGNINLVYELM
jgi:outer membrane protein TolC